MSEDDTAVIPSLDGDTTPVERPISKSQQKRLAMQRVVTPKATGKFEELDPRPLLASMRVEKLPENWPTPRVYAKWRVLEDREIPNGASTFLIQAGQILNEQHSDVKRCLEHGAKLEKLPD
jgi:hypothetical protein